LIGHDRVIAVELTAHMAKFPSARS